MSRNRLLRNRVGFLGTALVLLTLVPPAVGAEIVIANESLAVAEVAAKSVGQLFLGKSSKLDGQKVAVAVLSAGATHSGFLTSYVNKNPQQFVNHWRKLCFSGKAVMPHSFETEEELVKFVTNTPGAIGYISDTTPHDGVRTLAVN